MRSIFPTNLSIRVWKTKKFSPQKSLLIQGDAEVLLMLELGVKLPREGKFWAGKKRSVTLQNDLLESSDTWQTVSKFFPGQVN